MPDPVPLRDVLPDVLEQIETAYLENHAPANTTGASSYPETGTL
jgi:hypothetical protein